MGKTEQSLPSLVTWDQPEPLGKIDGTEWMCPLDDLTALDEYGLAGNEITNEAIRELAGGRLHHLAAKQYPEGYVALSVIDSETGEEKTSGLDAMTYSCMFNNGKTVERRNMVRIDILSGSVVAFPPGRTIAWTGHREICAVENNLHGTSTSMRPTQDYQEMQPDSILRRRNNMTIIPQARQLSISVAGISNARQESRVCITQEDSVISAQVIISQKSDPTGQLTAYFSGDGQVSRVDLYRGGLLDNLGLQDKISVSESRTRTIIDDKEQQNLIMSALSESLGLGVWLGFDLRLTAAGLYAAMGERNLNPTSLLVPRC